MSDFLLLSYKTITSKKNGKDYLLINLLYNQEYLVKIVNNYDELLEEFCKNNEGEIISEYVALRYNDNIKGFLPIIKYK